MATAEQGAGDRTEDAPAGMVVFGRHLNRREMLRLGGGLVGLAAVGLPLRRTEAQETPPPGGGPAVLVNAGEDPPAEPVGELRTALAFDPTNLDPAATYMVSNARWEGNVFSPLTWRDQNLVLSDGQEGRPSPEDGFGLAASWEYLDDRTLQMRLKTGITFQNGEPFTAESVRASYTRLLDPATASPQAFNYATIETVEVVDDATVIFRFNTVDPVMIVKMAGYGGYITPAQGSTEPGFGTETAAGSGPYRVVEYVKDDHLTLEAWDGFWGAQKPLIERLTYRVIPDDNTRLSEFLAGSIDVLTLNVSQAAAVEGNPELAIVEVGSPTVLGLRLDANQAPTDNKQVRLAIGHAIDLQMIIDTILRGYARPVGVWQSPFSFGFEDLPPYEYDPERSKQLLAEAGVATPLPVIYSVDGQDTQAKEIANAVKGMLDAVGFEVEIRLQEHATYFDDYRAGKLGNIVPFGWGGWTLDFDNTYYSMHKTGESYNPGYSNPEVDRLLDEQRTTLDPTRRLEIARQINAILRDDAPDVAMYQITTLWGVNSRVKNFLIPPDERLWWPGAWVEE